MVARVAPLNSPQLLLPQMTNTSTLAISIHRGIADNSKKGRAEIQLLSNAPDNPAIQQTAQSALAARVATLFGWQACGVNDYSSNK